MVHCGLTEPDERSDLVPHLVQRGAEKGSRRRFEHRGRFASGITHDVRMTHCVLAHNAFDDLTVNSAIGVDEIKRGKQMSWAGCYEMRTPCSAHHFV